jgi:hypothetical protein
MMYGLETYKAAIGGKAKIGVGASQTRQSVKSDTVYSNKDGRREAGLGIEFNPVGVMIIGHLELNYPLSINYSCLYIWGMVTEVSLKGDISRQSDKERRVWTLGQQISGRYPCG